MTFFLSSDIVGIYNSFMTLVEMCIIKLLNLLYSVKKFLTFDGFE